MFNFNANWKDINIYDPSRPPQQITPRVPVPVFIVSRLQKCQLGD